MTLRWKRRGIALAVVGIAAILYGAGWSGWSRRMLEAGSPQHPVATPPMVVPQYTSDSFKVVSSEANANNGGFACRSALLINESSDPVATGACKTLQAQLQQGLDVTVGIPEAGNPWMPVGKRLPDLIIRLELLSLAQTSQRTRAAFRISLGQSPWASHHSYWSSDSLPVVQTAWSGLLNHESDLTGPALTVHLGMELAKAVRRAIDENQKKYEALPALPVSVEGPFRPAPSLLLPETVPARPVLSGYRPFCHNETFWRLKAPDAGFLPEVRANYEASGWIVEGASDDYLRLRRNGEMLEFYPIREAAAFSETAKEPPAGFAAHYKATYDPQKRVATMESLFAANLPPETVFRFAGAASDEQRKALLAKVQPGQCLTPAVWFEASKYQEPEEAWRSLKRANALLITLEKPDELSRKIIDASLKLRRNLTLSAEDFRDAGFEELPAGRKDIERVSGRPVLLFWPHREEIFSAYLEIKAEGRALQINMAKGGEGRSSAWWGFPGNLPFSTDLRNEIPFRLRVSKTQGGYLYSMTPYTGPL